MTGMVVQAVVDRGEAVDRQNRRLRRLLWTAVAVAFLTGLLVAGAAAGASSHLLEGLPTIRVLVNVNGVDVESDVPPVILAGRTMLPIRAVAEAVGAEVGWDAGTNTVTLAVTSADQVQELETENRQLRSRLASAENEKQAAQETAKFLEIANLGWATETRKAQSELAAVKTEKQRAQERVASLESDIAQLAGELDVFKNPPAPRQETVTFTDGAK